MRPRFADIFQQGNRWLNWLKKQPEGSVHPVMIESVAKIMACRPPDELHAVVLFIVHHRTVATQKKVCFRYKSRSCPHCGMKAGEQWIQYLLSLVVSASDIRR